ARPVDEGARRHPDPSRAGRVARLVERRIGGGRRREGHLLRPDGRHDPRLCRAVAQGDVRWPAVSLGEAMSAALPLLQGQAESMMTDTCTITRPGTPVFNASTGTYATPSTTIYTGK